MTHDSTPVYPVDYVNALHQDIVSCQQVCAKQAMELADLRERDRVLSQQLDRRAGGRDAFTQALIADIDALKDQVKSLATDRDEWQAKYEAADRSALGLVEMYDIACEQKHRVLARLYEVYRQLVRVKRCPERPSCATCDYHLDAAIEAIGWVPPNERQETPNGD